MEEEEIKAKAWIVEGGMDVGVVGVGVRVEGARVNRGERGGGPRGK